MTDDLMMGRWRNPSPRRCGLCGTQWPTERIELVERLIASEKARSIAERKVRALMGDRDSVTALAVRVEELEAIVERQNQTIERLNRKKAS